MFSTSTGSWMRSRARGDLIQLSVREENISNFQNFQVEGDGTVLHFDGFRSDIRRAASQRSLGRSATAKKWRHWPLFEQLKYKFQSMVNEFRLRWTFAVSRPMACRWEWSSCPQWAKRPTSSRTICWSFRYSTSSWLTFRVPLPSLVRFR